MKWHKYTYIHSERVAHFVVHKFIKEQIVNVAASEGKSILDYLKQHTHCHAVEYHFF